MAQSDLKQKQGLPAVFRAVLLLAFIFSVASHTRAQVTIGMGEPPVKGALLEIKSRDALNPSSVTDPANVTSASGGLGLPRVQLVNPATLEPFIQTADPEWNPANQALTKLTHAGLMVYNLTVSTPFQQGVYVWDGSKWAQTGTPAPRWFYLPSFNLPLGSQVGDTLSFNLYSEYVRQFTHNTLDNPTFVSSNSALSTIPAPEDGSLYTAGELDYVITCYDESVLGDVSISADGVMTYTVKSLDAAPGSFMDVILVVRQ